MGVPGATIGGRSYNILHTPRRISFVAWAPRTTAQTKPPPGQLRKPPRSRPHSPVRRPPTDRPIPRRTPGTSGSARIDRTPPRPAFSAEQLAPAFRVLSIRSPTRTVVPPRNQSPRVRPQSSAIAPRPPYPRESPARTVVTRPRAQRMPRPQLARRPLSAIARHSLYVPKSQPRDSSSRPLQRPSMSP